MAQCDVCGKEEGMPYRCRLCGGTFCGEHRLPENHECPGLENWNDPSGVFDSGFDDTVQTGQSEGALSRVTSTGGPLSYFRGNVAYLMLGLMWVTFILEFAVFPLVGIPVGSSTWYAVFTVDPHHPLFVWTWVTSIFAHGGFTHILFNSIALYFFGPYVERRVGSKAFLAFFLIAGALAGAGYLLVSLAIGEMAPALGASGAIMGILGIITVLNPELRVYLYFFIPMPIWVLTAGYAIISVAGIFGFGGFLTAGIANAAHLSGLVVGLLYGYYLREQGRSAPSELQFGGGRRGRF